MIEKFTLNKSVLLRRIILLLLLAVLLSGLLSAGIYIFVSQRLYADMRAKELTPIARTVAEIVGAGEAVNMRPGDSFGADLTILNENGNPIRNSGFGDKPQHHNEIPFGDIFAVLSGEEVSHINGDLLIVGVPIETGGAVFLIKPVSELNDTLNMLNTTLIISTFSAFIIMLLPAYFLTRRLVIPIRQMRNVAHAMAAGDFTVRADESIKGEIGELGISMNHFAVESERLEQTRQDYVANVSHELRTPIASIRAMGETLRDGMAKTDEKRQLFYNNIVRESMRLSRLVDDLLELSRLQAGTAAMQKSHLDLREVLQNIADGYGYLANEGNINFSLQADMSAPISAISNSDRLEQVLVALMDNAIKHTSEGGKIMLSCGSTIGKLTVCVANTGEKISAADLPFVFERFYKVDKAHSGGGNGLGLSIAKEIIRGLGEKIWVESDEKGTKFVFTVSV
jgi:signal transduction histidine kinase